MFFGPPRPPVAFAPEGLTFHRYPFPAASIGRGGHVPTGEVVDVDLGQIPPAVHTRAGDLLFVPQPHREELVAWARAAGVPLVARDDVWSWLLEPFLDVETGEGERAREYEILAALGFERAEVDALRAEVAPRMDRLVAVTWEWVHLGLWDVLMATSDVSVSWIWRPSARARFYREAVAIALRVPARPWTPT